MTYNATKSFSFTEEVCQKTNNLFAIISLPPGVKSTRNRLKITLRTCGEERNSPVGVFLTYFFCGKAKECVVPSALRRGMPEGSDPLAGAPDETSYIV